MLLFFVKEMSGYLENLILRKKTLNAIDTIDNVEYFIFCVNPVPVSIININNDPIMEIFWLIIIVVPTIVIMIVVIHVNAAHKVAHLITRV